MPKRSYSGAGAYRYGFNGKENDNEVKGLGNQQDYGMRIYDPKIGRFLSIDPLTNKYPWYTPYQFAGNMPIKFIDVDGLEPADPQRANSDGDVNTRYSAKGTLIERDEKLDPVSAFVVGMFKTALLTFGALTQSAGAMHYGDKIPKENFAQEFPSIPNNNIASDLLVPSLIWPAYVISEIKKDPTNPEVWGGTVSAFVMGGILARKPNLVEPNMGKISDRVQLASQYFSKEKIPINQISGIDFLSPVKKTRLEAGTELIQWRRPGENPTGAWYSLPNIDPATLALPSDYSIGHRIRLTKSVDVIRSVAGT